MNEIKVSVSIILPGSVMLTQAEAKQLEKEKTGSGYDLTKLRVKDKKGFDVLNIRTRRNRTATQTINIGKEAYNYMVSKDGCPPDVKPFMWAKMKSNKRLEAHLNLVCRHFNGISYTYKIFDD